MTENGGSEVVTAAILVIGDEILSGRTKDKNIGYIAEYLTNIGIDVREVRVVPDIEAEIGLGGTAVSLALKSGEVWVFRHHSDASVALDASVYLERGRLEIRATKQIVLSDIVLDYSSQVSWSLTRAQDGNKHIRDVEPDDN